MTVIGYSVPILAFIAIVAMIVRGNIENRRYQNDPGVRGHYPS